MNTEIDLLLADIRAAADNLDATLDSQLARARAKSAAGRDARLERHLADAAARRASIAAHPSTDGPDADVVPLRCPDCGAPTPRGCAKGCGE